ncbi:MAG: hypothetical protein PVF90_05425 [Gemmatimonadota bacterium]
MIPNIVVWRGRMPGAARATRGGGFVLASLIVLGSVACGPSDNGDTVGPQVPGSIAVSTQTSGFQQDESYDLLVDGESAGTIGANDEMTIADLDPATYDVTLGDVADNCTVEATTATVTSADTASAMLTVTCSPADPTEYTLRANRDRPNLEDGAITVCSFGVCPTEQGWDLYAEFTASDPTLIHQNATTGVELAVVTGKTLDTLSEADVDGATFTTDPVADPFDSDTVFLVRTDTGSLYALGNPVVAEVSFTLYLTFDAVQLQ